MTRRAPILLGLALLGTPGCALFSGELPRESPPLAAMQEPTALLAEPDDELERAALEPGSFTGVEVSDARASLDALLEAPEGLAVARVVENSPAAQAGLAPGDVLLAYRVLPDGAEVPLAWTSEWRELELQCAPGTDVEVLVERAGVEKRARIALVQRFRPAERVASARLREEQRAGIVVRAPTEVEARQAGLAPGAGALVVGISDDSPWREGLRFEDLILAVDGERLGAPDVLIAKIRSAPAGARLELEVLRAGVPTKFSGALSEREHELSEFSIPLLFSYEHTRDSSETNALFWLIQFERTRAAWSLRLLWVLEFAGGDADRLQEVDS
jgi:C-terminal processing protease CtpA/Prc